MSLVLDTSVIIEIERGNNDVIDKLEELRKYHPASPKLAFMTYFEFIYGLRKRSIKNKVKSQAFLDMFEVIQTTRETANILSILKTKYELSLTDLMIAAQVIETNSVLVTKDDDFRMVEEIEKIFV